MTDAEKYLFDVHGYLVIEGALSPEEVEAANAAVDHYADKIQIRPNDLANGSTTLQGKTGRGDLGGMLTWEKPHCDAFRQMIAHPPARAVSGGIVGTRISIGRARYYHDGRGCGRFLVPRRRRTLRPFTRLPLSQRSDVLWYDKHGGSADRRGSGRRRFRLFAGQSQSELSMPGRHSTLSHIPRPHCLDSRQGG